MYKSYNKNNKQTILRFKGYQSGNQAKIIDALFYYHLVAK